MQEALVVPALQPRSFGSGCAIPYPLRCFAMCSAVRCVAFAVPSAADSSAPPDLLVLDNGTHQCLYGMPSAGEQDVFDDACASANTESTSCASVGNAAALFI